MRIDYNEYIKSDSWNKKRESVFKYQNICQKCWTMNRLNVHHGTYKRLWDEEISDLFVMCSDCHKKFHDKFWVRGNMMKLTKKYLWLTRKQLKAKLPKVKKEKPVKVKVIKEQSTKTIRKRKNKIFELDPARALEIMNKLEYLSEIWKCNFKHAVLCGITYEEWLKTQHFFLANSAKYKDIIIEELKNRISKDN